MLTIKQVLASAGLEIPPERLKLVKHVDDAAITIDQLVKEGHLDFYQGEQSAKKKVFHNCDAIAVFIAQPNNLALFHGVYRVKGSRPFTAEDEAQAPEFLRTRPDRDIAALIWYDLEELEAFRPLRNRLVAQWQSTRGWVQLKDLPIYELLPPVAALPFPGYERVMATWDELKAIYAHPRAHRDWKAALQANAGIYRIVDQSTGEIYIGSAYGYDGLWGRWQTYAKNGHGNNKQLIPRDPNNFLWSIVSTVSRSLSEREVIRLEGIEKAKHGSKARGLNSN